MAEIKFDIIQSLGGAVMDKTVSETAYYHRKAIFAQEYNTTWTNKVAAQKNVDWVTSLRRALVPFIHGDYVNWPDQSIIHWPSAYYGKNFQKLREVKTLIDPMNVFQFPQSIPPL